MAHELAPELYWLALTAIATGLMWLPHILWLLGDRGVGPALMDGEHDIAYTAPWAARARRAHLNAVENLAVFAALVAALVISGQGDGLTAAAAALYFFARVAHFAVYVAGLPVVRTLAFAVGVGCQLVIGFRVLGII
ncbi:MAPEG family protein [Limibaculum sp. FT325]|uniref:MAPEG family protein n=1 Tax=Thermohalobaculum sediminis TaxID=2939436 RepID=UPI0020C0995A|nr:MAPEG family protein [Limibaculum sediminis]MCL5776551.1 MAPEG family protein [Limibaculum sediminis]